MCLVFGFVRLGALKLSLKIFFFVRQQPQNTQRIFIHNCLCAKGLQKPTRM